MTHLNTICIVGRLTKEPRRIEAGGRVGYGLSLASEYESRPFKDKEAKKETTFIDASVWGPKAEKVANLPKGQEIFISGRLRMTEKVDDKTQTKRQFYSIAVETIMFNEKLEVIEEPKKTFTESNEYEDLPF